MLGRIVFVLCTLLSTTTAFGLQCPDSWRFGEPLPEGFTLPYGDAARHSYEGAQHDFDKTEESVLCPPESPDALRHGYPFAQAANGCSLSCDHYGPISFTKACNNHDLCYYDLDSTVSDCNWNYRLDLHAAYEEGARIKMQTCVEFKFVPRGIRSWLECLDTIETWVWEPTIYTLCKTIADTMIEAVILTQGKVYPEAQRKQRAFKAWVELLVSQNPCSEREGQIEEIKSIYKAHYGRPPTDSELARAVERLDTGWLLAALEEEIALQKTQAIRDMYHESIPLPITKS